MSKRAIVTAAIAALPLAFYVGFSIGIPGLLLMAIFWSVCIGALAWTWPGWTK